MSYCTTCGQKCEEYWSGRYRAHDGHKLMLERCPDACEHGDHWYEMESGPWWRFWAPTKCIYCKRSIWV